MSASSVEPVPDAVSPDAVGPDSACARCLYSDSANQRLVEMFVRHSEPAEIMDALCCQIGPGEEDRQVAFFVLSGETWRLISKSPELTPVSAAALARFSPEKLSTRLLDAPGLSFEGGWVCNLCSWTGEVLGMFVRFSSAPEAPVGIQAGKIDFVCRLAALAIEQKNVLDELAYQADHDPVTGLLNRPCFERLLAWRLREGRVPVLLCLNLDRFRLLNDVLGHSIGDRILKLASLRFQSCLGSRDVLARSGGDEFLVLLDGEADPDGAGRMADELLHSLDEPFAVEAHQLCLTACAGIAFSGETANPESLQREAAVALYHAKQMGRSQRVAFSSSLTHNPPERLEMEKRLRSALSRNEMLLHYQPQIDLASWRMTGVEALLRWKPEGVGIIAPASFIPILEETGLIAEFGSWVLREACAQGRRWADGGLPLRIAVNVSALQFAKPAFVTDVRMALEETGFPPGLLELELTESAVVRDYQEARGVFADLQRLGVVVTLDDFGTGQSSLAHLQNLSFNRLKIDRSFVSGLSGDPKSALMAENILRIARSLGMRSLAEGIDQAGQLEILMAMGCEEAQGYYFSTPMPAEEIPEFGVKLAIGNA